MTVIVSEIYKTHKREKLQRAIRETGLYRHYGVSIEGSLKAPGPSQHYRIKGFESGFQLGPHFAEKRQSLGQWMQFLQSGVNI